MLTSSAKICACFALWCFGLQWTDRRPIISENAAVEDKTGHAMLHTLFGKALSLNCNFYVEYHVLDLLMDKNGVC